MIKINRCLKCVFISFNTLFAIYGGWQTFGALIIGISSHQLWSWSLVFAFAVIGISSLGIFAANSENICGLRTFAGFMGAGMIIMLICGFYVLDNEKVYREIISPYIPNSFEIDLGIYFGLSTIALLGLLISLLMIHQIKRHDSSAEECSMSMNDVKTEASGPLTSALLQEEPAVKA